MSIVELTARIGEVTARISEIQSQLALLAPQQSTATGTSFTQALDRATAASATGATTTGARAAVGTAAATGAGTTATAAPAAATSGASDLPAGTPYAGLFRSAAQKYGVDARLLASVAKHESSFNPKAVSPAGAQGLMQLMPGTARGLGVDDPFDPAQAIDGAARMLRSLLREFGRTDLALAAYNAGPGAVRRYDGIPPYRETQNYVRRIMSDLGES